MVFKFEIMGFPATESLCGSQEVFVHAGIPPKPTHNGSIGISPIWEIVGVSPLAVPDFGSVPIFFL